MRNQTFRCLECQKEIYDDDDYYNHTVAFPKHHVVPRTSEEARVSYSIDLKEPLK